MPGEGSGKVPSSLLMKTVVIVTCLMSLRGVATSLGVAVLGLEPLFVEFPGSVVLL